MVAFFTKFSLGSSKVYPRKSSNSMAESLSAYQPTRTHPYKYQTPCNISGDLQLNTQTALRKPSLYAKPLNNLEIFIFFFADTSSVWINSTVKATGDIFSLDKQHCCRRISRPRSIFSLDKQHYVEADWLSIQVSVEKGFRILLGRGHLISLFGEVRCYELLGSAHWTLSYIMIGYSQVSFRVRHSDGRTTFTIKTYIYFEYLCPYTLVSIRCGYTFTNIITVTEFSTNGSWTSQRLAALSSGSRTWRPRRVPSSVVVARSRSQPCARRSIIKILLTGRARPSSWHAPHTTEGRS